MTPFDYAVGLMSILVSLALADVAVSLHKLLRRARSVRWDGRVLLSVVFVITLLTGEWFSMWTIRTVKGVLSFPFFLTTFFEFMVLFLVCAACLPDETAERDLRAFYDKNSRYLWSLVALFQTSFLLHWIYFDGFVGVTKAAAPLAMYLLLVMIRSRWFHYAALSVVIAFRLYLYWSRTLAV